jgi:hypothetical protein
LAALFLALVALLPALAAPAAAQAPAPIGVGPFAKGAVVSLKGTPHLWFADERGTLHWASDTRALSTRGPISNTRSEVTLEQLRTLPLGDPWLSTGLVKLGEPIYVVKWDTADTAPTLLHVQSLADLQTIGVTGAIFSSQVLDKAAWESKYGMSVDPLRRGELPSTGTAPAPETWVPFTSPAGGFSIWAPSFVATPVAPGQPVLPGLPSFPGLSPAEAANLPTDIHVFAFAGVLDGPTVVYLAGSARLPDEVLGQIQDIGPDLIFEGIRSELLKQEYVQVLSFRTVTQGTMVGRELSLLPKLPAEATSELPPGFTVPNVVITLRVFLGGNNVFALAAVNAPATAPTPDVGKFFDSFRLLPA